MEANKAVVTAIRIFDPNAFWPCVNSSPCIYLKIYFKCPFHQPKSYIPIHMISPQLQQFLATSTKIFQEDIVHFRSHFLGSSTSWLVITRINILRSPIKFKIIGQNWNYLFVSLKGILLVLSIYFQKKPKRVRFERAMVNVCHCMKHRKRIQTEEPNAGVKVRSMWKGNDITKIIVHIRGMLF